MHYCLVICQVSSTDQIYHRAAKRRGDKFDRSMTRGKLLGNNALLFIFISILIMTQLISFCERMKTRNSHGLLQLHVGREALAYCQCLYRENKALFVSVDLIGEKNQVILELLIFLDIHVYVYVSKIRALFCISTIPSPWPRASVA